MHFPPIKPEVLFNLGQIPITNSLITSWIAMLLLVITGVLIGKNFKRLPSGLQHIFEMAYEAFDGIAVDAMGKTGRKFVPLIVTFFLVIITNNWLGILPGVGSLGFEREYHAKESTKTAAEKPSTETKSEKEHKTEFVPLFRGGNADLNMTFALALIAQVVIHASGIRSAGLRHHLAHFKNPMEIITEISKILSFSFRLFGNIFAGEVMLTVMASIVVLITGSSANWFGIPGGLIQTPFFLLELFVGFIQAFVFAMLVISFLSLFVKTEHSGHAGAH